MKKASIQLKYDEEKLSAFQNIRTSIREYIESRETCEGRTGVRSQERRNTANRANEGILETGEGTWSTENS